MHELTHGLGFDIFNFQNAYDSKGVKRKLVEQRDSVWYVTAPRTLSVARTYFNCSSLTALPLMGENMLGASQRGSHWETRIMNDEFMAYGSNHVISAFTLAMLEDLGHYLANYSAAGCMWWGRNQGCDFVATRCATRSNDLSLTLPSRSDKKACARNWDKAFASNAGIVHNKCARPHCNRTWRTDRCNAECYSGGADLAQGIVHMEGDQCQTRTGFDNVQAAGAKDSAGHDSDCMYTLEGFKDVSLTCEQMPYATYGTVAGVVVVVIAFLSLCLHRENFGCLVCQSIAINLFFFTGGAMLLVATQYVYRTYAAQFAILASGSEWLATLIFSSLGVFIMLFSFLGTWAMCFAKAEKLGDSCCARICSSLGMFCFVLLTLVTLQALASLVVIVWLRATYNWSTGEYVEGGGASTQATGFLQVDLHIKRCGIHRSSPLR